MQVAGLMAELFVVVASALLPTTLPPFMKNRLAFFAITLEATAN
jgi:hypothetical protein